MEQLNGNPSSTFLVDAQTYQDLTEQARLGDLLADKVNGQAEEIAALKSEIKSLQENQGIFFDLLAKFKGSKEPGQTAQDRANRIDHYMDARPDHKASYEALKGFLEIDDVKLNLTIAALMKEHPGKYARQKDKNDGRKKWLAVIPKIA